MPMHFTRANGREHLHATAHAHLPALQICIWQAPQQAMYGWG